MGEFRPHPCTQPKALWTICSRFPSSKTRIRDFEVGPVEYMTASLMIFGRSEMILVSWEKISWSYQCETKARAALKDYQIYKWVIFK